MEKNVRGMYRSSRLMKGVVGVVLTSSLVTNVCLYDKKSTLEDESLELQENYKALEVEQAKTMESLKTYKASTSELEKDIKDYQQKLNNKEQYIDELELDKKKMAKENEAIKKQLSSKAQKSTNKQQSVKENVKKNTKQSNAQSMSFRMSHYTATCKGCSGFTATEYDVRNTIYYDGYRVLAVDPSIVPLGSIVQISYGNTSFKAIAIDKGGAIKGYKLDLLVGSYSEATSLGVKQIQLTILRKGW